MQAYIRFVIRHRYIVLALLAALTVAAGAMVSQGVLSTSLVKMFLGEDNPSYLQYQARIQQFGNDEVVVVGLEGVEPLSVENLDRLERVHDSLEANESVARVVSIANLSRVVSQDESILIRSYADEARAAPQSVERLIEEIRGDPVSSGLFISEGGQGVLVIVELAVQTGRPTEALATLVQEITEVFIEEGFASEQTYQTGIPAITAEIVAMSRLNIIKLFPIVLLVLLITVFLMFGRFWPVFITTLVALIAVLWTMAVSIALDPNVHILLSVVPGVVLIISFSDVIHLCSAYLIELAEGHEKSEAVVRAGTDVGRACLLTSATTGVGFLALTFIPTPVFRHMGLVLGLGVAIALLLAMTLGPILFSLMREPRPWRVGKTGIVQGLIDGVLEHTARISSRYPLAILTSFAALTIVAAVGISQIEFENYFEARLGQDNPVRMAGDYFDKEFAATRTIDIYVEAAEPNGLLVPETFHKIVEFQAAIEAMDAFEKTVSIVDLMEATHRAILPGEEGPPFLPTNEQALAQYLILLEMDGPDALSPFIDFNRRTMRISAHTHESGIRAHSAISHEIEAMAKTMIGDAIVVEVTGFRKLLGGFLDDIIDGQQRGLFFSFVAIALLMILGLRSVRAGVWSMLPNMLPLIALGGWLGWMWDDVDTDTFIVAMIAIGIGVDDTIHFLMRFRIESLRTPDTAEALRRTFHFAGRGIFITTVIFTVGFLPFLMSDYLTIYMLGTLLPLCFVVALVADFLFLPALVQLGLLRFGES